MSKINEEVDKFIRRYYDLELIIKPEARTIKMADNTPFADHLQRTIIDCVLNENADEQTKTKMTNDVFFFITKAYAYSVISSGQDLLGKLDECRKKNMEIMKDLAICMANYVALQKKHDRLVRMLDQNQAEGLKSEENMSGDDNE